jgi:hypothetical protein
MRMGTGLHELRDQSGGGCLQPLAKTCIKWGAPRRSRCMKDGRRAMMQQMDRMLRATLLALGGIAFALAPVAAQQAPLAASN